MHAILNENYRARACRTRAKVPGLLKGLIRCGHCGTAMARIVSLLVEQVVVTPEQVHIHLRADGLHTLLDDWRGAKEEE